MDQNTGGQSQAMAFLSKYWIYLVVLVIAIAAIVYFSTANKKSDQNTNGTTQASTQDSNQNQNTTDNQNQNSNDSGSNTGSTSSTTGKVSFTGVLAVSDNLNRGNLMVKSATSKVYIATKRDFGSLIGQQVTISATGTINQFVFLGLNSVNSQGTDTTAKGGSSEGTVTNNVSFSGNLMTSDNSALGNYQIVSGHTKVYLKTARDYSALVNNQVTLTATGTLTSFTQATIVKK